MILVTLYALVAFLLRSTIYDNSCYHKIDSFKYVRINLLTRIVDNFYDWLLVVDEIYGMLSFPACSAGTKTLCLSFRRNRKRGGDDVEPSSHSHSISISSIISTPYQGKYFSSFVSNGLSLLSTH